MRIRGLLGLPVGVRTVDPQPVSCRSFVTSTRLLSQSVVEPVTAQLPSRWLSDTKKRIGKCIMFGCDEAQVREAGRISEELARNWRELVAGSEGFLTGERSAGLLRRPIEWGEQDSMGHVNNVIYNRYAETARIFWASNIATHMDPSHKNEWSEMWTPKGTGIILRRIETVFKFPLQFPDKVTVLHKLQSRPVASTDSFALDVLILSELHQRVAARCLEDIVVYDYRKAAKTPLRGFMVDVFQEIFDRQEEAKRKSNAMVRDILERVTRLEKSSWDREGAVEKIGST